MQKQLYTNKQEYKKILDTILAIIPGAEVILFGSYARGDQHKYSDLDLCVVADSFPMRRIEMMHVLRLALVDKTDMPIDILLYDKEGYQRNAQKRSYLEYTIAKEGITLNA